MSASVIPVCTLLLLFASVVWCRQHFSHNLKRHANSSANDELVFAHIICRHGERNILRAHPTDPWKSEDFWPGGFGELTNNGKQQKYKMGQYLRKRYANLIGDGNYSPKKVFIQSTDIDRVIMSAQACLAGLFPASGDQMWNENINWQPIPVHTIPSANDYMLASSKQCDRYDYMMARHFNKTNYHGLLRKHRALFKYLGKHSGTEIKTLKDLLILHDTLSIEKLTGKRLPEWAAKITELYADFDYLARYFYEVHTATTEMRKIISGFLLKDILDRSSSKIQSTLSPDRTLWLYFGHDVSILNLLNSLGLYEPHIPSFGSCVFFELYRSDDEPYVKIFYKSSVESETLFLEIPNCDRKCPLEDLFELYWDILPMGSIESECALHSGEYLSPNSNPESYAVLSRRH